MEALELGDWMREMIAGDAKIAVISKEEYELMREKLTIGRIVVK